MAFLPKELDNRVLFRRVLSGTLIRLTRRMEDLFYGAIKEALFQVAGKIFLLWARGQADPLSKRPELEDPFFPGIGIPSFGTIFSRVKWVFHLKNLAQEKHCFKWQGRSSFYGLEDEKIPFPKDQSWRILFPGIGILLFVWVDFFKGQVGFLSKKLSLGTFRMRRFQEIKPARNATDRSGLRIDQWEGVDFSGHAVAFSGSCDEALLEVRRLPSNWYGNAVNFSGFYGSGSTM